MFKLLIKLLLKGKIFLFIFVFIVVCSMIMLGWPSILNLKRYFSLVFFIIFFIYYSIISLKIIRSNDFNKVEIFFELPEYIDINYFFSLIEKMAALISIFTISFLFIKNHIFVENIWINIVMNVIGFFIAVLGFPIASVMTYHLFLKIGMIILFSLEKIDLFKESEEKASEKEIDLFKKLSLLLFIIFMLLAILPSVFIMWAGWSLIPAIG